MLMAMVKVWAMGWVSKVFNIFKRKIDFMGIEDYKKRVRDIEILRFMDKTCKESADNSWDKTKHNGGFII